MRIPSISNPDSKSNWGIWGVIIGAIGASICCIGPLVLLTLGVTGAWVGSLAAFDAYRPYFMLLTLGFLGFAYYRVYRKPKDNCETDRCATPDKDRRNRIALWTVTVLALGLLSFPYLAPGLANVGKNTTTANISTEKVVLTVNGMTCGGCALTTQKSLEKVNGVISAEVTYDPPQAVVTYDPNKVKTEDLTNVTTNVGYPSTVHNQ